MRDALGTPVIEAEDEAEPDWVDELALSTERLMVVAGTLQEDRNLVQGARRLLADLDEVPPGLTRRIFEAVAGVLLTTAADEQRVSQRRRGRPGRE